MATGYTGGVSEGKVTEFPEFAMQCARAFGALIMMRDDAHDAEIPEEFKPSDYYEKELAEAKAELAALEAMDDQAVIDAAEKRNAQVIKSQWDYIDEKATKRVRYEAMLSKVNEWTPPTGDHSELKRFMINQLCDSIKFDCSDYTPDIPKSYTPTDWLNKHREVLKSNIVRYADEHAKECERAAARTAWVKILRESLKTA